MTKHGKRYDTASRSFDRDKTYGPVEAFGFVKANATAKFDETIEASFRLGIDARKADQAVRGTISLPHGIGKDVRIAVFAKGDAAKAARDAGADFVGDDDLLAEVAGGMLDFDVAIATPDMMAAVGRQGRVLGPRGLMPNPKSGTVTPDVGTAVGEFKSGRVEYRNDRFGNVHLVLGKASFDADKLVDNYVAAVDELTRVKPTSAKGRYFRSITVSSTMGPGVQIDVLRHLPDTVS